MTISHDLSLHSNITFERCHHIGGLLLLVPADRSVEHQNTDDDTEIDPVLKTGSKKNSKLHDYVPDAVSCRFCYARLHASLTIQNGTLKVAKKLQEQVLLLRRQLVESGLSSSFLDFGIREALLDVGQEPIFGDFEELAGTTALGEPSLVEWPLLCLCGIGGIVPRGLTGSFGESSVAIGGNVSDEVGIFTLILVWVPARQNLVIAVDSQLYRDSPAVGEAYSLTLRVAVFEILLVGVVFSHDCCYEWRVSRTTSTRKKTVKE